MTSRSLHSNAFAQENDSDDDSSSNNNNVGERIGSIPRPSSLLMGPSTGLSAPSSLLSAALPSMHNELLLDDSIASADFSDAIATRPRRLWTIQDTSLRPIPKLYPPMNPNSTVYVGDASPSVVAVRISECFRKRSLAVEYDDESITALVSTVDRCVFQVQLWKGNVTSEADFSHGVVVECIRISGSTLSFQPACRAVLQAAMGQSTGDDHRPPRHSNGLEFNRMIHDFGPASQHPAATTNSSNSRTTSTKGKSHLAKPATHAALALEQAKELLRKDRFDTQYLGIQRLVNLTTPSICGTDVALFISLNLLQQNPEWLVQLAVVSHQDEMGNPSFGSTLLDSNVTHSTIGSVAFPEEARHESLIRSAALRVLCNVLSNATKARMLSKILTQHASGHPVVDPPMLNSLVNDLKGANRPPSIAHTTLLASPHEAALAVRILRLLGESSPIVKKFLEEEDVLERLEFARSCGRATHLLLQQETEQTYAKLTEDVRSC